MATRLLEKPASPDEWGYLALVAVLPVMQPLNVQFDRYTVVAADFLSVVAVFALVPAVLTRHRHLRWCSWYPYLLLYAVALLVSTVTSQDVRRSALKLAGVLNLIGLAVLTTCYVTSMMALRRAITAWLLGLTMTVVAALSGVVLFFAGVTGPRNIFLSTYGSLPPGPYPRVMGLFLNANMLCTYVVAGTMILLGARAAGWVGPRMFVALLTGSIFTALATVSPALGGLVLAVAIWYSVSLQNRAPRFSRLLVAMGWTGAAAMLAAVMISPAGLAGQTASAAYRILPSSRVLTWIGAWQTFSAHLWFGRGLGLEAADVHYLNASGFMVSLTDAHNLWLSILAQQGIVGAAAFGLLVFWLVRRFRPLVLDGSQLDIARTALQLALVGGFLYQSLSGSFENTRHMWVLMGLVASTEILSAPADACS